MPELLIPFAIAPDGRMVAPTEVERGLACNCICPTCRAPLLARQGTINAHHFAHVGDTSNCIGAYETATHLMAKQVVLNATQLFFPPLVARYLHHTDIILPAKWLPIANPRYEPHHLRSIVPDVLVEVDGRELVVEITVTHPCTPEKLADLHRRQLPAIEISLARYRHINPQTFESLVLHDAPRAWLFNPRQQPENEKLTARIIAWIENKQREEREAGLRRLKEDLQRKQDADRKMLEEHEAYQQRIAAQQESYRQELAAKRASRAAAIAKIAAWAETYYPARANPPPPELATIRLTDTELTELFAGTTSLQAHLALIDQPPIRDFAPRIGSVVRETWIRHGGIVP
jgi:hypothetical protein